MIQFENYKISLKGLYPAKRVKPFLSDKMIITIFRPFFQSLKIYNGISQKKGVTKMSKQTNMTTGNPVKLLLSFAIPLMLGTIFQQSFIIVDRIIVGHLIGANAFASVGRQVLSQWYLLPFA